MKRRIFLLLFVSVLLAGCRDKNVLQEIYIVPEPFEMNTLQGHFTWDKNTRVLYREQDSDSLNKLLSYMRYRLHGTNLIKEVGSLEKAENIRNAIILKLDLHDRVLGEEGYHLQVNPEGILLQANTSKGLFYGLQTMIQLLPLDFYGGREELPEYKIPAVDIVDKPRFSYRGMHLDVGRHMFPVEFIKQYIDLLAFYKFNIFHWHLTEDQGWRIEIKKYPELMRVAAFRDSTLVGHYGDKPRKYDGKRYGGYYTQEEVKDIVQYAAERNITIIPEIEMPGHSLAALAAYPELACSPGPFRVATEWGVFEDVYCPKEETFEFLENVLLEVMELFPGKYIHIGGDEVPKTRWKKSAYCQQLIQREGLQSEEELQSYFIRRIENFLNMNGRHLIGWDEILEGGLSPNATVMSWRGTRGGLAAAKQGHDAVMTPGSHCYFDHYQANPKFQPLAIGGYTTLKKVYEYEPVPDELTEEEAQHILGAQGNVWTEYLATPEDVEYMILPRLAALAEVDWSPVAEKSWPDFQRRINQHYKIYEAEGLNYCKGSYAVSIETQKIPDDDEYKVSMSSEIFQPVIRFTLDGSEPAHTSKAYSGVIKVPAGTVIKAAVFVDDTLMEEPAVLIVGKETNK